MPNDLLGESERAVTPDVVANDVRVAILRTSTSRRLRTEASEDSLSPGRFPAKRMLADLRELPDQESVPPPSKTRIVRGLTGRGLFGRSAHPVDGRRILAGITPSGEAVVEQARNHRIVWLARRVAVLSEEDGRVLSRAANLMQELSFR
jgi:DNA-binding MarR family transcriptional regulator